VTNINPTNHNWFNTSSLSDFTGIYKSLLTAGKSYQMLATGITYGTGIKFQSDYAVADAMKIIKLGQMISRDNHFVGYVNGLKIRRAGIDLYGELLLDHNLYPMIDSSVPQGASFTLSYSSLKNDLEALKEYDIYKADTSIKLSYLSMQHNLESMRNELKWYDTLHFGRSYTGSFWEHLITFYLKTNNFYFNVNMTLNQIADENRKEISYLNKSCIDLEIPPTKEIEYKTISERVKMYFTKNSISNVLFKFNNWETSGLKIKRQKCENQSALNALKINMATKLYLMDNGKFPKTLEELSPKYLEVIPIDVYTGGIPKYNFDNKMLEVNIPQGNLIYPRNKSVYNLNFE
jgi:hypothetical protein